MKKYTVTSLYDDSLGWGIIVDIEVEEEKEYTDLPSIWLNRLIELLVPVHE